MHECYVHTDLNVNRKHIESPDRFEPFMYVFGHGGKPTSWPHWIVHWLRVLYISEVDSSTEHSESTPANFIIHTKVDSLLTFIPRSSVAIIRTIIQSLFDHQTVHSRGACHLILRVRRIQQARQAFLLPAVWRTTIYKTQIHGPLAES